MKHNPLQAVLSRIAEYANKYDPSLPGGVISGRIKAFVHFIGLALGGESEAKKAVPEPLGVTFKYDPVKVDKKRVLSDTAARHRDENGDPAKHVSYEQIHPVLWDHLKRAIASQINPMRAEAVTEEDVSGKDHLAWVRNSASVVFDLGDQIWRLGDLLRSIGVAFERPIGMNEVTFVPKEALSDGVVAIVRPELLGLPANTWGVYQVRGVVTSDPSGRRDAPITRVWRMFKGLVIVSPKAKNVMAWDDGYGRDERHLGPAYLHLFSMLDVEQFEPRSRYTLQGLYYSGVANWWRAVFAVQNLRSYVNDDSRLWDHRLLAANAPVRAFGGHGLTTVLGAALGLTVSAGKSRVVVGATAFRYIHGWEHVADIEDDRELFDNSASFNKQEHIDALPRFYAPERLKKYYMRAGGLLGHWALNRRPDLPTGQCVIRHQLEGFVPLNVFVVPTWSMLLSGCDFDGDMLVVFPPEERGGLYTCFNDFSIEEQQTRLAGAVTDRKDGKKPFQNAFWRWCSQLEAGGILGKADMRARRLIDSNNRTLAYSMQPWIQVSVDRQKYLIAWPDPNGPLEMPGAQAPEGVLFATDLLRDIAKADAQEAYGELIASDSDDEYSDLPTAAMPAVSSANPYQLAWSVFQHKLELLRNLGDTLELNASDSIWSPSDEMTQLMLRWGIEMHRRLNAAAEQLPYALKRDGYGQVITDDFGIAQRATFPLAHVVDFPDRNVDSDAPLPEDEVHAKLVVAAKQLDRYYVHALRDRAFGANKGLDNLKDGLVDAADYLGVRNIIAEYVSGYRLFRYFATPDQLKTYFESVEGLRLGDLFTVIDDSAFVRHSKDTFVNQEGVFVGFNKFAAGELKIVQRPTGGFTLVLANGTEVLTQSYTIQDAIIQLQMRLNASIPALEEWNPVWEAPVEVEPLSEEGAADLAGLTFGFGKGPQEAPLLTQGETVPSPLGGIPAELADELASLKFFS